MRPEPIADFDAHGSIRAMSQRLVRLAFLVCLAAAWGCGSRAASQGVPSPQAASRPPEPVSPPSTTTAVAARPPEESPVTCRLIAEPGEPIVTVALGERVDSVNAPHPSNESERLLFRQLYETLVRVDCDGKVGPGLAASWQIDTSGRTWIVTLRENARFSDGTPVTAADVVSGWTIGGIAGNELRPEILRLVQSVLAVDDRTLAITLRRSRMDAPLALAHTDLAIARRVPGSLWPLGTRPATIASDGEKPARGGSPVITLLRLPVESASSVRFLVAPGRDARDLLDEGVDLLLTRDPKVLDYAATLPQFVSVALAWQRTHVLLTPGRARTAPSLSAEARQALADDAVRGEARGALGPFWWQSLQACEMTYSQPREQSPSTSIVYDGNDSAARDLAERLVGLAGASGPGTAAVLDALLHDRPRRTYQRAVGLTGEALVSAQRRGNDAGYIMAFDSRPLDPCREMQVVLDTVGWVDPETIVPMVETRMRAIVRRGRSGVTTEGDGGLLLLDGQR